MQRFVELENCLSDLLGIPVDLVMAEALKPNIGRRVLAEVESIGKVPAAIEIIWRTLAMLVRKRCSLS